MSTTYEIKVETHCLECGEQIKYGRSNRKFCNNDCKNKFHNERTKVDKAVKSRMMYGIKKNYNVLEQLLRCGITTITMVELRHLGFRIEFVTSYQKSRRYEVYRCLDISFKLSGGLVSGIRKLSIPLALEFTFNNSLI